MNGVKTTFTKYRGRKKVIRNRGVTTAGNTNSADYILPYGLTTWVRQL